MSEPKSTIRYMGYRSLSDGGREFDFALAFNGAEPTMVTVGAAIALFQGPTQIAIQEAAGICYETLKTHIQTHLGSPPSHFDLKATDVAEHRKSRTSKAALRSQIHNKTQKIVRT